MSSQAVVFEPEHATDSCPWCGSIISREEFEKIEARIAEQERERLAAERARMQQRLETHKKSTEMAFRAELEKKVAELNAEREQREAAVQKEAATKAERQDRGDMEKKLTALGTE